MTHSQSFSGEVLDLAEEFLARYRKGERPPLCEYTDRHPHLAEQIREVFPAMALMENIAIDDSAATVTGDQESRVEPALQQLGDYRIIREVGRGGMGIVYEAEQVSLGRHVALKVLPRQMLLDGKQKRRFEREAKSAARLHHTNIVPVLGVGEHEGMHYYVMQFIQGLGLDQVLTELRQMHGDNRATAVMPMASQKSVSPSRGETAAAEMARSLMTGGFERTVLGPDEPAPTAEVPDGAAQIDPANPGREAGGFSARPAQKDSRSSANSSGARTGTTSDASSGSFSGLITLPGQSTAQSTTRIKKATYWQSVAQIGQQVASALQYAHDQGILHRDIKPSNLLLDLRGTVWIADFGLAKANDQQEITHTGDILGTLRYMPPEAFEGKGDPRSDLYSLGLTLYELLALKPAFDDKDRNRLIQRVTTAEAPRLEALNPAIPRDLATIVHKAIDREPEHRYQSAGELADDLQRYIDDDPIDARSPSYLERLIRWSRRNRGLAAALGAIATMVTLFAMGALLMAGHFRQSARENRLFAAEARRATARAELRSDELQSKNEQLQWRQYVADMQLARRAIGENNTAQALRLLEAHVPEDGSTDFRGFEWYYLRRNCSNADLEFQAHNASTSFVSFQEGDTQILSLGLNVPYTLGKYQRVPRPQSRRECRLWDIESGRPVESGIHGILSTDQILAASADGTRFVRQRADRLVEVVVSTTGQSVALADSAHGLSGWGMNPSGDRAIAFFDHDSLDHEETRQFIVWDCTSGERVMAVGHLRRPQNVPIFCSDGSAFAVSFVAYGASQVRVWKVGQPDAPRVIETETGAFQIAFSPDQASIATGSFTDIVICELESDVRRTIGPLTTSYATCVCYNKAGDVIAIGGMEGQVELFNVADGARLANLKGATTPITAMAFNSDGTRMAVGTLGGKIFVWSVPESVGPTTDSRSQVNFDDFWKAGRSMSPDGRHYVAAFSYSQPRDTFELLDVKTGQRHAVGLSQPMTPTGIDWSGDGRLLFLTSASGRVEWIDVAACKSIRHTQLPCSHVWKTAVDGAGKRMAAFNSTAKILSLFDLSSGRETQRIADDLDNVFDLSFSHDGQLLAVVESRGTVTIWSSDNDQTYSVRQRHELKDYFTYSTTFSPDGSKLAVFGRTDDWSRADAHVFDLNTGTITLLRGHSMAVVSGDFSPDGRRIVTAGWDKTARLWDTSTGQELLLLSGHQQFVIEARFFGSDHRICSMDGATNVRIWDATIAEKPR